MVDQNSSRSYQNTKPCNKIYLSSLPSSVSENQLKLLFGRFGEIKSIKLFMDKKEGFCRGFGSMTFVTGTNIDRIFSIEHTLQGRTILCEPYIDQKCKLKNLKKLNSRKKIFVSNIPSWMTNNDIKDFFSQYGKVESAYRIQRHGSNRKMPFGYTSFYEVSSAEKCLEEGFKFMGNKFGFMLFDKYTKDKKERDKIKNSRERKIREYKKSMERTSATQPYETSSRSMYLSPQLDYGSVNNFSFTENPPFKNGATQMESKQDSWTGCNQIIPSSGFKKDIYDVGGLQNQKYLAANELNLTVIRRREAKKRLRQLKFGMLKPTCSKYWKFSIKRLKYFQLNNDKNYRINTNSKPL